MPIKRVSSTVKAPQFVKSKVTVQSMVIRDDITCGLAGCTLCKEGSPAQHIQPVLLLPTPLALLSNIGIFESELIRRYFKVIIIASVMDYIKEKYSMRYRLLQGLIQRGVFLCFQDKSCKDTSNGYVTCTTLEQLRDSLSTSQHYYSIHERASRSDELHGSPVLILVDRDADVDLGFPIVTAIGDLKARWDDAQAQQTNACSYMGVDLASLFSHDFYNSFITPMHFRHPTHDTEPPLTYEQFHSIYLNSTAQPIGGMSVSYLEHMQAEKVEDMLSKNQLLAGKVTVFGCGRRGEVVTSYKHAKVLLCNPFFLNRCLAGDQVALALVDREAWDGIEQATDLASHLIHYNACEYINVLGAEAPGEPIYGIVVAILNRQRHEYCGTIKVPFLLKQLKQVSSHVDLDVSSHAEKTVMLRPFRRNLPDFFIRSSSSIDHYIGKRVLFIVEAWNREDRSPTARISTILGDVGDRDVEAAVVLFEYDVPYNDLQADNDIMLELRSAGLSSGSYSIPHNVYASAITPAVQPEATAGSPTAVLSENIQTVEKYPTARLNLTDEYAVSVDPLSCKDIDDALHLKILSPTTFEVGVHIADVSFYVRPESAIDLEARKRGTSVYLPDRRIDMLPTLLTEDICSLRSNVDRLAMSVLVEMELGRENDDSELSAGRDPELDAELARLVGLSPEEQKLHLIVKKYSFTQTIICSKASLAYQEAQWLCETDSASVFNSYEGSSYQQMSPLIRDRINDEFRINQVKVSRIQRNLKTLLFLSKLLKLERLRDGALTLETPAVEFTLDSATKLPTGLHTHVTLPTMSMIEEFMLLANRLAAEYTLSKYPSISVLRRHPKPSEDQFLLLKHQVKDIFGIDLDTTTNKSLGASILLAASRKLISTRQLSIIRQMLTRCMMLAKYFVSSEYTLDEFYHYGLALPIYTHFTSPIRRYSDILVHRLLAAADGRDVLPATHSNTEVMSQVCNNLNLRKENADRASSEADKVFSVIYVIQKWRGDIELSLSQPTGMREKAFSWSSGWAGVLRISDRRLSVTLREYGVEVDIRLKPEDIVARDPGNMWIDLAWNCSSTAREGTGEVSKNIRRIAVFDELYVQVGLDFSRLYDFDLHIEILDDPK